MEPIAKTLLERFQVRKNARQKADFYNWLETLCKENGTSCRVESGGLLNSRNIVFGDPDTAEILLTAHYDTCARMPFPNLLFPRNILLTFLVQLGCLLPSFYLGAPRRFCPSVDRRASFLCADLRRRTGRFSTQYHDRPGQSPYRQRQHVRRGDRAAHLVFFKRETARQNGLCFV